MKLDEKRKYSAFVGAVLSPADRFDATEMNTRRVESLVAVALGYGETQ
jgi:hypothetical protein